jgi:hypothetical protein
VGGGGFVCSFVALDVDGKNSKFASACLMGYMVGDESMEGPLFLLLAVLSC